jgi:UDP-N-acetyl-D-mannosaminuronate dehydrogenase
VFHAMQDYGIEVLVYDPWASADEVRHEYGIDMIPKENLQKTIEAGVDAVILAVSHKEFHSLDVRSFVGESGVVYDVKGILPTTIIDDRL